MKKLNIYDIGGDIVKEDERYIVRDNKSLNNLIVSSTDLKPIKITLKLNNIKINRRLIGMKG